MKRILVGTASILLLVGVVVGFTVGLFTTLSSPQQVTGTSPTGVMRFQGDYLYASPIADTFGNPVEVLPSPGFTALVPLRIVFLSSTPAQDERVHFRTTATFSDGTSQSTSWSFLTGGGGGHELYWTNYLMLVKDGLATNKLTFDVKSSLADSPVKVQFWVSALNQ